jgi:NAD-dependent dihydropyrimidine dehydrogenase PreA subunit
MVDVYRAPITAAQVKAKARELGADLVGIADGRVMDAHPPYPGDRGRPIDLSALDSERVIVLAKRTFSGTSRIRRWDDRHKFYNDELALTRLEQLSLELVYWLEAQGYPAIIVPPTHVDPWRYDGDPGAHQETLLSLTHAAVEAGLGTLGLNLQLLTPEYGPRVILTAVLCSAPLDPDRRMEESLCLGPECGRCLRTCPGDTVRHWDRDWAACDRYRHPYGFRKLTEHLGRIIDEDDPGRVQELLVSEDSFYLWQSILRGAGAINGCRNCEDDCPVGQDYARALAEVREEIADDTPAKRAALARMCEAERAGNLPETYQRQRRWIGRLAYLKSRAVGGGSSSAA